MSDTTITIVEGPTKAALKKLRERLLNRVQQQYLVAAQMDGSNRQNALVAAFVFNVIQMEIGKIIGEVIDDA